MARGRRAELRYEWQRHVDGLLRVDVAAALVVQVAFVPALLATASVRLLWLWVARWLVAIAVVVARRRLPAGGEQAVVAALAAHVASALAAAALVPDLTAAATVVLVADVQICERYLGGAARRRFRFAVVAAVAAMGALAVQHATGGSAVPSTGWMVVLALLIGLSAGAVVAHQGWDTVAFARRQAVELLASRRALTLADGEALRSLTEAVEHGPRRSLRELAAQLEPLGADPGVARARELAELALERAAAVIAELRDIAHGIGPAATRPPAGTGLETEDGAGPLAALPQPGIDVVRSALFALRSYVRTGPWVAAATFVGLGVLASARWHPSLAVLAVANALSLAALVVARRWVDGSAPVRAMALVTAQVVLAACAVAPVLPIVAPALVMAALVPSLVAPSMLSRRHLRWAAAVQAAALVWVLTWGTVRSATGAVVALGPVGRMVLGVLTPVVACSLLLRLQQATVATLDREAEELRTARTDAIAAYRRRRGQLERDLHDGAQQVVVALGAQLRVYLRRLGRDDARLEATRAELSSLVGEADGALGAFCDGTYPSRLVSGGLAHAVRHRADLCAHPTDVRVDVGRPLPPAVELAVWFCCSEALQNVGKHAGDGVTATVTIVDDGDALRFEVVDTGRAFVAAPAHGAGLRNMAARLGELLGELDVAVTSGGGCRVRGRVPLAGC